MNKRIAKLLGLASAMVMLVVSPAYADETVSVQTEITGSVLTEGYLETDKTSLRKGDPQQVNIHYYLYTPANAQENMPLIVYLHSSVPKSGTMDKIKDEDMVTYLLDGGKDSVPAYVLMPYISVPDWGWKAYAEALPVLIEEVVNTYKIDRNRISITGWSMGATNLASVVEQSPDLFSCAVFLSGYASMERMDVSDAYVMSKMPCWFLYEAEGTAKKNCEDAAEEIRRAGGIAYTTEVPGVNHETFLVFDGGKSDIYGVIDWMVEQRKQPETTE